MEKKVGLGHTKGEKSVKGHSDPPGEAITTARTQTEKGVIRGR